jgi:hypothetical protein
VPATLGTVVEAPNLRAMPFFREVRTIEDGRAMMYVRSGEHTTLAEWNELVAGLQREGAFAAGMPLILDMRAITTLPAPGQVLARSERISRLLGGRRVAMVTNPGGAYGIARQIGMMTGNRLHPFEDLDEALRWLFAESE